MAIFFVINFLFYDLGAGHRIFVVNCDSSHDLCTFLHVHYTSMKCFLKNVASFVPSMEGSQERAFLNISPGDSNDSTRLGYVLAPTKTWQNDVCSTASFE